MDLMINNAYNNTIAEKFLLQKTSCMKKQFLEEEGIFGHIFAPVKWATSQGL